MMTPRALHGDGSAQPLMSTRIQQPRQLSFHRAQALLRRPRHHMNRVPKPLRLPRRHVLTPIKGRSRALVREGWPRRRTGRRIRLSHANACNPLLQAHPTWARGNTKAAGFPFAWSFPPSCFVSRRPIWAGTRSDNLLVGPGTPRGRNADSFVSHPYFGEMYCVYQTRET
jgi:hypothetical protein